MIQNESVCAEDDGEYVDKRASLKTHDFKASEKASKYIDAPERGQSMLPSTRLLTGFSFFFSLFDVLLSFFLSFYAYWLCNTSADVFQQSKPHSFCLL